MVLAEILRPARGRFDLSLLLMLTGVPSAHSESYMQTVATVAEMTALRSNRTDAVTWVIGRFTINDGGGGAFVYDAMSDAATNLGTVFRPNEKSGRWIRVFSGELDVKWFGARGDGTSDDWQSIQSAVAVAGTQGTVVFPPGVYAISQELRIGNSGLKLLGKGTGTIFSGPTIKWIGPADQSTRMIHILPARHGAMIENLRLDAGLKAGTCLHIDGEDGSTTHRTSVVQIHFLGYTSRALVIGKDSISDFGTVQMQNLKLDNLSFEGGLKGAIGVLLNAQNCEWALLHGAYFDPEPGKDHSFHIYNRAGGLNIIGLLTTRSLDYAVVTWDQLIITGWRAEDRLLLRTADAEIGGPLFLSGIWQRQALTTQAADTIYLRHSNAPIVLNSVRVCGSIRLGPTSPRHVSTSGVVFEKGGGFMFDEPNRTVGDLRPP